MRVARFQRWLTHALLFAWAATGVADAAVDALDIDAPAGHVIGAPYFGQHLHYLVLRNRVQDPPRPTAWPDEAIGALRLWDSAVRWGELEPERGLWRFDRMDRYVDKAEQHGVPILYTLGSTPRWASARPDEPCSYGFGCAAEPHDLADWEAYVTAVATRYKGRIAHYELWNEPHPGQRYGMHGFFTGTTEQLVQLAERARAALAQADPAALLLTPGFVNREPELERFLALGGASHVQGVTYHFYASGDRQLVKRYGAVQASRRKHGLLQAPLFNTESGFGPVTATEAGPGHPERTAEQAAALGARSWILGTFLGLERWYHHSWDGRHTGMVTDEGLLTPNGNAWLAVRRWLLGARPQHCRMLTGQVLRCTLQTGEGPLWILWRPDHQQALDYAMPPDVQVRRAEHAVAGALNLPNANPATLSVGPDPLAVWLKP